MEKQRERLLTGPSFGVLLASVSCLSAASCAHASQLTKLTQAPCQFIESENGIDRGYRSGSRADCEEINARTAGERLAVSKPLRLKPGRHVFRVTNRDVPYELGFWLRGASAVGRATLPAVSGGGLAKGKSRDYEVDLKPGDYVYSCPLNSTPDYRLIVR